MKGGRIVQIDMDNSTSEGVPFTNFRISDTCRSEQTKNYTQLEINLLKFIFGEKEIPVDESKVFTTKKSDDRRNPRELRNIYLHRQDDKSGFNFAIYKRLNEMNTDELMIVLEKMF